MTEKLMLAVRAEVKDALSKMKRVEAQKKKMAETTDGLSKAVQGLTGAYSAATGALAGLASGFVIVLKNASDLVEANNKFQVVFASVKNQAKAMRDVLVNSYGQSKVAATEMLGTIGGMLTGFGFAREKALHLSTEVAKLAIDLSSFANIPVSQAVEALTKGLVGEREMMKALGITISEADLKQRLFEKGQNKLVGTALRQAKSQATLELAFEQSTNAIGDYNRSLGSSAANQFRLFKTRVQDAATTIGLVFLPVILRGLKEVNYFFSSVEERKVIKLREYQDAFNKKIAERKDLLHALNAAEQKGNDKRADSIKSQLASNEKMLAIYEKQAQVQEKKITRELKGRRELSEIGADLDKAQAKLDNAEVNLATKPKLAGTTSDGSEGGNEYTDALDNVTRLTEEVSKFNEEISGSMTLAEASIKRQVIYMEELREHDADVLKNEKLANTEPAEDNQAQQAALKAQREAAIEAKRREAEEMKQIEKDLNGFILDEKTLALAQLEEKEKEYLEKNNLLKDKQLADLKNNQDAGVLSTKEAEEKKRQILEQHGNNQTTIVEKIEKAKFDIEQEYQKKALATFQQRMNMFTDYGKQSLSAITSLVDTIFSNQTLAIEKGFENQKEALEAEMEEEKELKQLQREDETEAEREQREYNEEIEALSDEEKIARQQEIAAKKNMLDEQVRLDNEARQQKMNKLEEDIAKKKEEREAKLAKLEEEKNKKLQDIKRRQFDADKGSRIAEIIMNTATGIMRAWVESTSLAPFIIPIITTLGAVQLGTVAGQVNPYFRGGIAKTPQLATLAEEGKPEMVLPPGITEMMLFLVETFRRASAQSGGVDNSVSNVDHSQVTHIETITIENSDADELVETLKRETGTSLVVES